MAAMTGTSNGVWLSFELLKGGEATAIVPKTNRQEAPFAVTDNDHADG